MHSRAYEEERRGGGRGRREDSTHNTLGPLIDGLHEPKLERGRKIVVGDLVRILDASNHLGNVENNLSTLSDG